MKIFAVIIIALSTVNLFASPKDKFKKVLDVSPDDQSALYNFGLASFSDNEFENAIKSWERLYELEPDNWQIRVKLIQAYWSAGKEAESEKAIKELRAAHKRGKPQSLKEQKFFIRDQFTVNNLRVFTLEYFALEGRRPLLWKFLLRNGDEKVARHFSIGSYPSTTNFMRANGELKKDERAFHLDGYSNNGDHETYAFYKDAPDYGSVRESVTNIQNKSIDPISSSKQN